MYCNFCGKKQEISKRKTKRRARGSGSISRDSRNSQKPYIARAVPLQIGGHGAYIGSFSTIKEAQAAIEQYEAKQKPDLYNATVKQIYEKWSEKHVFNHVIINKKVARIRPSGFCHSLIRSESCSIRFKINSFKI